MSKIKPDKITQKIFEPENEWVLLARYQRALLKISELAGLLEECLDKFPVRQPHHTPNDLCRDDIQQAINKAKGLSE